MSGKCRCVCHVHPSSGVTGSDLCNAAGHPISQALKKQSHQSMNILKAELKPRAAAAPSSCNTSSTQGCCNAYGGQDLSRDSGGQDPDCIHGYVASTPTWDPPAMQRPDQSCNQHTQRLQWTPTGRPAPLEGLHHHDQRQLRWPSCRQLPEPAWCSAAHIAEMNQQGLNTGSATIGQLHD